MVVRLLALLAFVLCCSISYAEPPDEKGKKMEIPLSEIWANNIPGTKEIGRLAKQDPRLTGITSALGFPPKEEAKPAFAVQGKGLDALREAHAVIVDKRKSRDTFAAGSDVSVVFFAHETRSYVHLHKVERQGNNVNVSWRFVPHETEDMTRHVALISLGKLPSGKYRVNIIRSAMPQKYIDLGFRPTSDEVARRIVCGPFSFTVSEQGE